MSGIDQKEYLKKYLSGEDAKEKKKKRKKKAKTIGSRVKIIDDDLDNHIFNEAVQEDLNAANEDAPQIVGVIDDRPLELRMDDFKSENVWKSFSIGGDNKSSPGNESPPRRRNGDDYSPPRKDSRNVGSTRKYQWEGDDDSPPRRINKPVHKRDDSPPSRGRADEHSPQRSRRENKNIERCADAKTKSHSEHVDSPPRRRNSDSDTSPSRNRRIDVDYSEKRNRRDGDNSPPRKSKIETDYRNKKEISRNRRGSNNSPPRKRTEDDYSPPRKNRNGSPPSNPIKKNNDDSPARKRRTGDDSPQRKRGNSSTRNNDNSPRYKRSFSPPRKRVSNSPPRNKDRSPQRRVRRDSDNSPPRKRRMEGDSSPARKNRRNSDYSPRYRRADDSPMRKRTEIYDDSSPPRKNTGSRRTNHNRQSDDDNSPPRKIAKDGDNSPLRERGDESGSRYRRDSDNSPPRKKRTVDDNSPPRKQSEASTSKNFNNSPPRRQRNQADDEILTNQTGKENPRREKKSRWGEPSTSADKLTKTLDGKTAGLQNAKDLVQETRDFKRREDDLFKNMAADISGANASTIMRDRKTGKIRDLGKEAEQKREKDKEKAAVKEKYDKWGKGVKQVEEYNEKLEQDVYEMSKPLARYADDEDLEKYLKEQERDGDPMLAYIRKKKKKVAVETGKPLKPQYEGEFMPNRFGIRPGHKWDGVDRSNGYEKRWFEVINAKQAEREEIYKWSTEDM